MADTDTEIPMAFQLRQFAQNQAPVERADVNQLRLEYILLSAEHATVHATHLIAVGKPSLTKSSSRIRLSTEQVNHSQIVI